MFRIWWLLNTLRPRQNDRHFADDIFKCTFLNENIWISLKISLKFVPKVRINNIPAETAPGHYLNQWWLIYWRIYASRGFKELMLSYLVKTIYPTHAIFHTRTHIRVYVISLLSFYCAFDKNIIISHNTAHANIFCNAHSISFDEVLYRS